VLRLKHPIRGIDRSHSDSEIDQSISDGYVLHQRLMVMGMKHRDMKHDQTGVIPDSYSDTNRLLPSCTTYTGASTMLPQGW
jgi:hypothetical protein